MAKEPVIGLNDSLTAMRSALCFMEQLRRLCKLRRDIGAALESWYGLIEHDPATTQKDLEVAITTLERELALSSRQRRQGHIKSLAEDNELKAAAINKINQITVEAGGA